MVAVDVHEMKRPGEPAAVAIEPCLQSGVVDLFQVPPEDQATPTVGIGACDGEHAVKPAAGLHAQADQPVERLRQIDLHVPADTVSHHGERVREGVPELPAQEARAAGRLHTECVAQPVVLREVAVPGQQRRPFVRRRGDLQAVHRIFVRLQAHTFEHVRDALA